jgi:TPR repeat protein
MRWTLLFVLFLCSLPTAVFAQTRSWGPWVSEVEQQAEELYSQQDFTGAYRLFLQEANRGSAYSEVRVGEFYETAMPGLPVRYDPVQSFAWYQKAAEQGYPLGQFMVGKAYWTSNKGARLDHAQSFTWYKKAAEQGYVPAELEVASYYCGEGTAAPDYVQAWSWYKKAAANGPTLMQPLSRDWKKTQYRYWWENLNWTMGKMYMNGLGVPKNYAWAVDHLQIAAGRGFSSAAVDMGKMYLTGGFGLQKNLFQARRWFSYAAGRGNQDAQSYLAQMDGQQSPAPPAPANSYVAQTAQLKASQGTCTAIHSALHSDNFGHWYSFGAAWGRSTLAEAESAARSELIKASNGTSINFNSDEVLTPFSGCTYGHGAVVAKLKGINGSLLGNGIYDLVSGVVDATTQGAIASAMEDCNRVAGTGDSDGPCTVMLQW